MVAAAAAATPITREWDAQSLLADAAGPFFPPVGAGAGNSGSPGATVEYLRDLVQKRIITLTYTRNVHDGYVLDVLGKLAHTSFASLSSLPCHFDSDIPPLRHALPDEVIGSIRS